MNAMERAIVAAAEYGGAPPRVWNVDRDATVEFGTGHPFDQMQLTAWVDSFDVADVAAGRCE